MSMRGYYRVYADGELLGEFGNTITSQGRSVIGKFLAGERTSWSDSIAIGSGGSQPNSSNTSLDLEFFREEVDLTRYVEDGDKIILRTIIPTSVAGKVYELGVYSSISSETASSRGPSITNFDTTQESWSGGQDETDLARVGLRARRATLSSSTVSFTSDFVGDVRTFTDDTVFRLAYYAASGVSNISVRFKSSDTDYRQYSFAPSGDGSYQVESWRLQNFQVVGNPSWNEFYEIEVLATGTGLVVLDAITSVEEKAGDELNVLVSRALVNFNGENFIFKKALQELQLEYVLELSA